MSPTATTIGSAESKTWAFAHRGMKPRAPKQSSIHRGIPAIIVTCRMKELKQNKIGDANTKARLTRRAFGSGDLFRPTYTTFTSMAFGFAFSDFGR